MTCKYRTTGDECLFKDIDSQFTKNMKANNCYAYAVGSLQKSRPHKSVPGHISKMVTNRNFTQCGFKDLVLADGKIKKNLRMVRGKPQPGIFLINPCKKCPVGTYKVAAYTAPQGDFHWMKQHSRVRHVLKSRDSVRGISFFFKVPSGIIKRAIRKAGGWKVGRRIEFPANVWSHKRGWATPPLLVGSDCKAIKDPVKAVNQMKYNGMHYSNFCKTYCVRKQGIHVGALGGTSNMNNIIRRLFLSNLRS